jgi:hypothetical protein
MVLSQLGRVIAESESELLYHWWFTANLFRLGDKPLETHDQNLYFPTEYSWL